MNKRKKRERKGKENAHRRAGGEREFIFLLSVGDKREILKLTFNTIYCLMKHNLSC